MSSFALHTLAVGYAFRNRRTGTGPNYLVRNYRHLYVLKYLATASEQAVEIRVAIEPTPANWAKKDFFK